MGCNWPHPPYCPQFLHDQHKIEIIGCPVERGAHILGVRFDCTLLTGEEGGGLVVWFLFEFCENFNLHSERLSLS